MSKRQRKALLYKYILASLALLQAITVCGQQHYHLQKRGQWNNKPFTTSQIYSSLWGWTASDGKEYAIMGGLDSIYFIEISNPDRPVLRAVRAGSSAKCSNREFKTYSHYCYAAADACQNASLQIFDLQYLPDSVHKVYDIDTIGGNIHNLYVDNMRLYMADNRFQPIGKPGQMHALTIASLKNPEAPEVIAQLEGYDHNQTLFNTVHDLHVRNDTAYLSNGDDGLFIYNLKKPKQPKLIQLLQKPYPDNGYNHSNWISDDGKHLVFTDESHGKRIKLYDISEIRDSTNKLPELKYISYFGQNMNGGSIAHNAYIKGNFVFVAYYHEGVLVYDISDPAAPAFVCQFDTYYQNDTVTSTKKYAGFAGCWNVYPYFPSGTIIASDMSNGLFVFRLDTGFSNIGEIQDKNYFRPSTYINNGNIIVHSYLPYGGKFNFTLSDLTGRQIWAQSLFIKQGGQTLQLPCGNYLPNTMYLLSVSSHTGTDTFRLIKK